MSNEPNAPNNQMPPWYNPPQQTAPQQPQQQSPGPQGYMYQMPWMQQPQQQQRSPMPPQQPPQGQAPQRPAQPGYPPQNMQRSPVQPPTQQPQAQPPMQPQQQQGIHQPSQPASQAPTARHTTHVLGGRAYDPLAALNSARREQGIREAVQQGADVTAQSNKISYAHVLEYVQTNVSTSEEYTRVLSKAMDEAGVVKNGAQDQLKNIIYSLLQKYRPPIDANVIEEYQQLIYDDMTGIGLLTPYIADEDVEEINVFGPGPNQIEIVRTSSGDSMLEEGFNTAEDVLNVAKRMVRKGNMVVDASNPRVDSYMENGIRVSAMIPPIIRDDKGAVISIRKQTKARITKQDFIKTATAMKEEFDFMELCVQNNVSGAIVGATGSGKTTLLNYLLTNYVETSFGKARVYIIEESRELQLPADAKAIYTAVTGDAKSNTQITAPDLLKSALRFHPNFITCAEMRGEEALNAMNAAQTGHVVWSTFHADNCEEAYTRLLTMCKMSKTDLSEDLLMRNLVSAFPLIVSSQQLRDGTRKVTGIYEADRAENGVVYGHYIFKLQISNYERDETGRVIKISGRHARVGHLSDRLAQRIFDNCGQLERVKQFARPDWVPESMNNSNEAVVGNTEEF